MRCDKEVNWLITDFCNFNCVYCFSGLIKNKFIGLPDIEKIVRGFNKTGLTWLICFSGGEPFLFPDFVTLCQKLTEKHIISLNTNLSHKDVYRFAEDINPDKVRCIHCSMHIHELKKRDLIKEFIKKFQLLKIKGFYVFASYVLYPPFFNEFFKDYDFFKSEGIILRPKVFRGGCNKFNIFNLKIFKNLKIFRDTVKLFEINYPGGYTKQQKKLILSYIERSQNEGGFNIKHKEDELKGRLSDVYLEERLIDGLPSFKGKYCMAGKVFVRMTPEGEVFRCYDDEQYLGNLFNGKLKFFNKPTKCKVKLCSSPYMGFRDDFYSC